MKRIIFIIMVFVAILLYGCNGNGDGEAMDLNAYLSGSQDQQGENLMKIVTKALDEKDPELLKSVFSEETKVSCPELDRQIEELFAYYEGPTVSFEGNTPYASGQTSLDWTKDGNLVGGQGYWDIQGEYQIQTQSEKYWVTFAFYSKYESAPEKNGIYCFEIITDALRLPAFGRDR